MRSNVEEAAPPPTGTPLYVHLPFCAAKCHYCDFFSVPDEGQDIDGLLDAVIVEARSRAPRFPRTVYLGGGTPSLLSTDQLTRLLDALDESSGFRESAIEVTVECNPESLDEEKAAHLLDKGATRLSIGFQSLHDEVLELFGRVHSVEDSFKAFQAARDAGVEHLNVDMIFAVPDQTPESWAADLDRILQLQPEHVSAYNLTFEEQTTFKRWLEQGKLQQQSEEAELEMFLASRAALKGAGFRAYEVSNFGLWGEECRHNLHYWRNGPYVGLGPSAVSKVGQTRFGNVRPLAEYKRRAAENVPAAAWDETLDPIGRLGETWWLSLRLHEGVRPDEARERASVTAADLPEGDPAHGIAEHLAEQGLLERVGERFRLTERGLPLADAVAREFLGLSPEGAARTTSVQSGPHEPDTFLG